MAGDAYEKYIEIVGLKGGVVPLILALRGRDSSPDWNDLLRRMYTRILHEIENRPDILADASRLGLLQQVEVGVLPELDEEPIGLGAACKLLGGRYAITFTTALFDYIEMMCACLLLPGRDLAFRARAAVEVAKELRNGGVRANKDVINPFLSKIGCEGWDEARFQLCALLTNAVEEFLLAHELGHILCGHTTANPKNEHEADTYATYLMLAMGARQNGLYCWRKLVAAAPVIAMAAPAISHAVPPKIEAHQHGYPSFLERIGVIRGVLHIAGFEDDLRSLGEEYLRIADEAISLLPS